MTASNADSSPVPWPRRLLIEMSRYCQLRCPKCPTGLRLHSSPDGHLSWAAFEALLTRNGPLVSGIDTITFSSWGEPFLNPQWYEIITSATRRGIRTTLSTNLNHRARDFAAQVVDSGLSKMTVAIDGASEATYLRFRRGGDWGLVMRNLEAIARIKSDRGVEHPELIWQMVLTRHNHQDTEMARTLSKHYKMGFKLKPLRQVNLPQDTFGNWAPAEAIFRQHFGEFESKHRRRAGINRCEDLWLRPNINWDGEIYPCCIVDAREHSLGNAFDADLSQLWAAKPYAHSRRLVLDASFSSSHRLACAQCPHRADGTRPEIHPEPKRSFGVIARRADAWISTLERASHAAFEHVELRIDSMEPDALTTRPGFGAEVSAVAQRLGLSVSIHAMEGIDCNEPIGRIRHTLTDLLVEQLELGDQVGARWLTLHVGRGFFRNRPSKKQPHLQRAAVLIREALRRTAGCKIGVGLENLPRKPRDYGKCWMGDRIEELEWLLAEIDDDRAGIVWDFGHAHLDVPPAIRDAEMTRANALPLYAIHFHYNNGTEDTHRGISPEEITREQASTTQAITRLGQMVTGDRITILEIPFEEAVRNRARLRRVWTL